jgi:hypothetical protein
MVTVGTFASSVALCGSGNSSGDELLFFFGGKLSGDNNQWFTFLV